MPFSRTYSQHCKPGAGANGSRADGGVVQTLIPEARALEVLNLCYSAAQIRGGLEGFAPRAPTAALSSPALHADIVLDQRASNQR